MMKRADKLMTMKGADLIVLAEKFGVKVACNKAHTQLKESKQAVIDRIIAAESKEAEPEQPEVEVCGDGTPYAEVMQEIIMGAETRAAEVKKEKKSRKKRELSGDVSELLKFIITEWEKVGIVKTPKKDGAAFRPLCVENGRQVIKLMWTTKKISFFVRVAGVVDYAEKWQKINYALPFQCMFFNDTEETRQNIKNIFNVVMDADSVRQKKEKVVA